MRIITLHCDYIRFKPLKKAIKVPELLNEERKKEITVKDPLVILIAVEKGDNDSVVHQLCESVKKTASEVSAKNIVLYPYAHLSSNLASPDTALEYLTEAENVLNKQGFNVVRAPFGYYKEFELKVKGHPLSELSKEFRADDSSASSPRPVEGKEKKIILDRRNLKPNDHRILGEELGIFHLSDEIGPGLPLWLPNGEVIRYELMQFMHQLEEKNGYKYVSTPHITKGRIYEKTGHIPYYADTMFSPLEIEGVKYYLKPMNCPHHHIIFSKIVKSYRDLPLRLAEPGSVYRNELSGVTYGLMRVRSMTQNDAHIYTTPEKLKDEFLKVMNLIKEAYKIIGIKGYWFRLSLPDFKKNPEKYTGDPKLWDFASEEIKKAMKSFGEKFLEGEGEAAFYGPKIDVQIKNSQGKEETLSTVQVDIVVPQRLNLTYTDDKGKDQHPIVIHRAPLGSYERFVSFLLEQTEGKMPVWLSPIHVRMINFTDKNTKAAQKLIDELKELIHGLRIDSDFRSTTVNDKIRDASLMKIPYVIVIGDKEEKHKTLAVRTRDGRVKYNVKIKDFVADISRHIEKKI